MDEQDETTLKGSPKLCFLTFKGLSKGTEQPEVGGRVGQEGQEEVQGRLQRDVQGSATMELLVMESSSAALSQRNPNPPKLPRSEGEKALLPTHCL